MRREAFILCFLLFSRVAFPQGAGISFDRISIREGLADHSINCITQDHIGFLWIGGESGLYRYDGYEFKSFQYKPGDKITQHFKDIYRIKEDRQGLLWILSEVGIVLFDPEFSCSMLLKLYSNEKKSTEFNYSPDIHIDSDGVVWATYRNGLIRILPDEDLKKIMESDVPFKEDDVLTTEYYELPVSKPGNDNMVTKIFEDSDRNMIIGSSSGLFLFDKKQGDIHEIAGEESSEGLKHVRSVVQDEDQSYWIAAGDYLYNMEMPESGLNDDWNTVTGIKLSRHRITGNQIPTSLFVDSKNNILMGTIQGFYRIDKDSSSGNIIYNQLDINENDPEFYGYAKTILDIFEDRSGVIWTAQDYYGITRFYLNGTRFNSYRDLIVRYFENTDINPVYKDNKGFLWVGTYGGGLHRIKLDDLSVSQFDMPENRNNIICMQEVSPGLFWLGTSRGIAEFNVATSRAGDPSPPALEPINQKEILIWDMLKDENRVWFAARDGLYVFDSVTGKLNHYSFATKGSSTTRSTPVLSLLRMKNGDILAATATRGLFKISYNDSGPVILQLADSRFLSENGISLDRRHRLFEDSSGLLWVVDYSGLHRMDLNSRAVVHYRLIDRINYPDAWSIVEDSRENLWIGTHFGLCCFNKVTEEVKIYNRENGLPIIIHGLNSVFKDTDGRLYFGGIGGFYDFLPESLMVNEFRPPVVITDFRVSDKSLNDDPSGVFAGSTDIPYMKTVKLKHDQNDISIRFSALNYIHPDNNRYSYRLEGYQEEWVDTDADSRTAEYMKLKPGTYTFLVKGSNSDGIWNEEVTSLKIIIRRPWWSTWLALFGYLLIITTAILGIFRWRLYVLQKEREELEKLVGVRTMEILEHNRKISEQKDQLEKQNRQIQETEELKNRFFSNISHEFRTPLSLIMGPAEELLDKSQLNDKERRKIAMIARNGQRLLNLVNQLLDLSKIDGKQMTLELIESDVIKHLKSIAGSFVSMAEAKSINFQVKLDKRELVSWFDYDKIEKIATNILSNAFKFTPVGGEIDFSARYIRGESSGMPVTLEFSVKDTGPGIQEKSLEKIFDRFYQVQETLGAENQGTGIGLSLSLELARLMHGDISVSSVLNSGSVFTVTVPLGKDHLDKNEYVEIKRRDEMRIVGDSDIYSHEFDVSAGMEEKDEEKGKPVILIVDDNRDMRGQLSENLEGLYNVRLAVDGISGLKKALDLIPDLIVTDLMMPNMGGMELCRLVKENELTCHVPVIMLTAKDTSEDRVTGLETGADDYIAKPFRMQELKARVANLINQRRQLRERFSREIILQPSGVTVTSADEKFLNKAIAVIEERMKDETFSLDEFHREMNLSRSTMFRKLSALTGQSPTEFIRTIRLKRAAALLLQNFGNVSEVSYEVGIYNISWFNRSFKQLYGVSPGEYVKKKGHVEKP